MKHAPFLRQFGTDVVWNAKQNNHYLPGWYTMSIQDSVLYFCKRWAANVGVVCVFIYYLYIYHIWACHGVSQIGHWNPLGLKWTILKGLGASFETCPICASITHVSQYQRKSVHALNDQNWYQPKHDHCHHCSWQRWQCDLCISQKQDLTGNIVKYERKWKMKNPMPIGSVYGIFWVVPPPSKSYHQDYYIFNRESL